MFPGAQELRVWTPDCIPYGVRNHENPLDVEKQPGEIFPPERRRDARIVVNVPVEITKIDETGHEITERTFVEDVSDFGCRFSIRETVKKGDTVAIRLLAQDGKSLSDEPVKHFEVMWAARGASRLVVGARICRGEKLDKARLLHEAGNRKLSGK
jgi:hypothetical protein